MGFEIVLNGLWLLLQIIYFQLEAIVRFFIRPGRKDVSGEIVLVTGAGSGIGQRLSIEFAKLGCTVVGWDISTGNLEKTTELMKREVGKEFHAYTLDLSDREAVYETAKVVKKEVGKVDILINNAGIVTGKTILECPDQLMQKTLEINTMAHFWTLKAFLPDMLAANHGHIVTVASGAGYFGLPGQVDYAASKFGAVGLTEALHHELNHSGASVNVTCVCPYYVNTGMFDGVKGGLMPILDLDYVVSQTVDAILRNKVILMLPRLLYLLAGLKNIVPIKTLMTVGRYTGVTASMDEFLGRKKTT